MQRLGLGLKLFCCLALWGERMDGWILKVKASVTAANSGAGAAGRLGSRAWTWFQAAGLCRHPCVLSPVWLLGVTGGQAMTLELLELTVSCRG